MRKLDKYKGIIPAFYACYDKEGNISPEGSYRVFCREGCEGRLCKWLIRGMYLPECRG